MKKRKDIIRKSVVYKHHPVLKRKNVQEMWTTLKDCFQHVSPMGTLKKLLEMVQTKLSDCKDIHEYTSIYQAAYNQICNLTIKKSDLNIRSAGILLQAAMLINMSTEYAGIVSTIKLE